MSDHSHDALRMMLLDQFLKTLKLHILYLNICYKLLILTESLVLLFFILIVVVDLIM